MKPTLKEAQDRKAECLEKYGYPNGAVKFRTRYPDHAAVMNEAAAQHDAESPHKIGHEAAALKKRERERKATKIYTVARTRARTVNASLGLPDDLVM